MRNEIKYMIAAGVLTVGLNAGAEVIPFEKALQMAEPPQEEFTMKMSFGSMFGRGYGMAAISFNCAKDVTLDRSSKETVKLYYGGELMAEADTGENENSGITNIGVSLLANDDVIEFESQSTWLIMFDAMAPAKYKKEGEYTVVIPEGLFVRRDEPVGGAELHYKLVSKLTEKEPTIPFNETFTYALPSASEFTLSTSYKAEVNDPHGMAAVTLDCPRGVTLVKECKEKAQLYFAGELIGEIGATDGDDEEDMDPEDRTVHSRIRDVTKMLLAEDDGLIDFGNGRSTFLFMFDDRVPEKYLQAGAYTLKVPEGLFAKDGVKIAAGEIGYTYLGDVELKHGYTVTPEPGTVFALDKPIKSLTIEIDGMVNMLDYASPVGKLYNPDGKAMVFASDYPMIRGNRIIWEFNQHPKYPQKWIAGEYTFKLPKETINVNSWAGEGVDPVFPEEDLNILYILGDGATGVTVVGLEKSPTYTVYTLDGCPLAIDANADALTSLPSGLYIINGRQVRLTR